MRLLAILTAAALTASTARAAEPPDSSGWELAKVFLFKEARQAFLDQEQTSGAAERHRRLGLAVAELNVQPRTQAGILRVRRSLESLTAENPADHAGILARYLTARILEMHQQPPDPAAAARLYRELVENHPGHEIAEAAAAPLAQIELYLPLDPPSLRRKFRSLEALAPRLLTPAGKRDLHLALAYAALDILNDSPAALRHFLAADAAGITRPESEADAWLRTAELARALGRGDTAITYYEKFITKYPRNYATPTARKHLATLRP